MRRDAFWGFVFKIIMWIVILGVPLYFYLTIFQPLLTELFDTLEQVKTTGQNVQGTGAEFALRLQEIGEYFRGFWGVKE